MFSVFGREPDGEHRREVAVDAGHEFALPQSSEPKATWPRYGHPTGQHISIGIIAALLSSAYRRRLRFGASRPWSSPKVS